MASTSALFLLAALTLYYTSMPSESAGFRNPLKRRTADDEDETPMFVVEANEPVADNVEQSATKRATAKDQAQAKVNRVYWKSRGLLSWPGKVAF